MTQLDGTRPRSGAWPFTLSGVTAAQWALVGIMALAIFTRFWRLGTPDGCYFDEVYFPTTASEILRGDRNAWQFYGHENTHPPLSKEIMALGMALPLIGGAGDTHSTGNCWGDAEDQPRSTDPNWTFDPVGWRFFGALAGVGAVLFMYLLSKRLFQSEVAALSSAAFLAFDGVALAQSRIGTPDTYVLFFVLGTLYLLVSERYLLSGIFYGAAVATKWIGAFTILPIIIYLVIRVLRGIQDTPSDERLAAGAERVLKAAGALLLAGFVVAGAGALLSQSFLDGAKFAALPLGLGALGVAAGIVMILLDPEARRAPRARMYLQTILAFPVFFLLVPAYVYLMTYLPMFIEGYGLGHMIDLNREAYEFHSSLTASHASASPWWSWPIMQRPVYFFVDDTGGDSVAKIYSLGNPAVFWMGIGAMVFVFFQALDLRLRFFPKTANLKVAGALRLSRWPLIFVALSYLAVWLPWAVNPRVLFIYHYLPALIFVILALGYCVDRLWRLEYDWGRTAAVSVVAVAALLFLYFYPHWTALDIPRAWDESYYWFASWR
jgi:dolichyl-phosphate-mannose--protein O-mannosyl transferase